MSASADILILASGSPRRRELLTEAGVPLQVVPSCADESPVKREAARLCLSPGELVCRLAALKARDVAKAFPGRFVLGADTVVAFADRILGKPADLQEAEEMLLELSGKSHQVLTGVALCRPDGGEIRFSVETRVYFRNLDREAIRRYFSLVNPLDKAGGYAIQEHGEQIISAIEGSRTNVIGLPMDEVLSSLDQAGFSGVPDRGGEKEC